MKLTYPLLLNAKPQDKPYKIRDRDSMYLRVSVSDSKVWKFDYRLDGKDCSYTLGRFPDLSISAARQRRNNAAKLVASGIHPKSHEQQFQLQTITHNKNTFWAVFEDWIEDNRDRWSEYYCGQAIRFLSRYVKDSALGKMAVRDIKVAHVYDLLQSIVKRKTLSGDERKAGAAPHIAVRLSAPCLSRYEPPLKKAYWVRSTGFCQFTFVWNFSPNPIAASASSITRKQIRVLLLSALTLPLASG